MSSAWLALLNQQPALAAMPRVTPTPTPGSDDPLPEFLLPKDKPMPMATPTGTPGYLASDEELKKAPVMPDINGSPFYLSSLNGNDSDEEKQNKLMESMVTGSGMSFQTSPYIGMGAEERALQDEIKASIEKRKGLVGGHEKELNSLGERPTGFMALDLSPAAALVDSWTGSNLQDGYKGPQKAKEYAARKAALQDALSKEQAGLTDDQIALLRMHSDERRAKQAAADRNELARAALALRERRADRADDGLLAQQYSAFDNDSIIKKYVAQSDNVTRGYHTLMNPPSGIITNQMAKEITNEIANALASGGQSAESDREKTEFKSLEQSMINNLQYFTGRPMDSVPEPFVRHLAEQLIRIREAFGENIAMRAEAIKNGRKFINQHANDAIARKAEEYKKLKTMPGEMTKHDTPAGNVMKDLGLE